MMKQLMTIGGYLAALVGVLICAIAGLSRVAGSYHLAGFETITLFQGGTALMVLACLFRLYRGEL